MHVSPYTQGPDLEVECRLRAQGPLTTQPLPKRFIGWPICPKKIHEVT